MAGWYFILFFISFPSFFLSFLCSAHPSPDSAVEATHSLDHSNASLSSPDAALCTRVRARACSHGEGWTYDWANELADSLALSTCGRTEYSSALRRLVWSTWLASAGEGGLRNQFGRRGQEVKAWRPAERRALSVGGGGIKHARGYGYASKRGDRRKSQIYSEFSSFWLLAFHSRIFQ